VGTLDQTAALRMLEATPGVISKTYDEELNAYEDIVNGRLFGVLLDYPIAKYYASPNPELELTGPPFGQVAYGIAIDKSNIVLKQAIDGALHDIIVRLARYSESRLGKGRKTPAPSTKTVGPEGKRWKRDRSDVRDRPKAPKTPTSNSSSFRRNKPSIAFCGAKGPGALQVIGDPLTTLLATGLGKSTEPTELQTMPFSSQLSSPLRTRCASFFPRKSTLFFML
jgi:hypothetical protein